MAPTPKTARRAVKIGRPLLTTHKSCVALMCIPTNLAIDDELLEEALDAGGFRTKRETVN